MDSALRILTGLAPIAVTIVICATIFNAILVFMHIERAKLKGTSADWFYFTRLYRDGEKDGKRFIYTFRIALVAGGVWLIPQVIRIYQIASGK